jgi:hypothetical protein
MRQLGLGILLALSILAPRASRADDKGVTVQQLLDMCNTPVGSPEQAYCLGFVGGLSAVMLMNGQALRPRTPSAAALSLCAKDITYGAEVQAFKNWAQAHPENWQMPDQAGVVLALRELWPCK